jgi:hypothetical protein
MSVGRVSIQIARYEHEEPAVLASITWKLPRIGPIFENWTAIKTGFRAQFCNWVWNCPPHSPKERTLGLLGPCFVVSLAGHNFDSYICFSPFSTYANGRKGEYGERRTTLAKAYGIKVRCYGEHVGGTHWELEEHIRNLMRTHWWELKRNIVRTHWEPRKNEKKSFQHPPLQNLKGYKARHLECMLWPSHWLHEICLLKRVHHHFWPRLIPLAKNTLPIGGVWVAKLGQKWGFEGISMAKFGNELRDVWGFFCHLKSGWIRGLFKANWGGVRGFLRVGQGFF